MMLEASFVDIKRAFLDQGAVLGADGRGHYLFRSMGGDDALYAVLVMLRFISDNHKPLSVLRADMP